MTTPPILAGLRDLADAYDGYIVDLWGVLHNGYAPYPGAVDCLERLRAAAKRVCLLSNAPRRVAGVVERLREMGVPDSAYDHVMTSGEATREALLEPPDAFHAALGQRFLHIGPPRDTDVYEGTRLERVGEPGAADFVLCTGIDRYEETLDDYAALLRDCAAHRLPLVCANPDLVVIVGEQRAICAGALAAFYEELGCPVAYHGKPHPSVYRRCFDLLGVTDRRRILAVGDSFHTDIAGANAAGIDSLLVVGGIHAEELARAPGTPPEPDRIHAAARTAGFHPTAVVPSLVW